MKTIVIIPAFNEAENIEHVVTKLRNEVPELDYVIVNDCSKDNLVNICKERGFNYISLPVNLGIGGAVQTGYKYALLRGYDIAVQHDGDGQHDPSYIRNVIAPIEEGKADIVIGSRFIEKKGFQSSIFRRTGIVFLSVLLKICYGIKIYDITSGFRAVNRKYMELYAENYPYDYPEPEAIATASLEGAHIMEVPVVMNRRVSGESSINFGKSIYYIVKVSLAIVICRIINWRR